MTVSYPLSLPTSPDFRTCRITPRHVTGATESPFTLEAQVFDWQVGRWEADLSWPPMTRSQAAPIIAALTALRYRVGTILLGDPDFKTPRGVATGTPTCVGVQTARSTALITTGWTASTTGILKAGDRIGLGSGGTSTVHMVLNDADSDAFGTATLDVWPALRADLSGGETVVTDYPKAVFRLASPFSWDADEASIFGVSVSLVEAL